MSRYTEWCDELEAAIAEPFDKDLHGTKSQGGSQITFVSWTHYVQRLNDLVGASGWTVDQPDHYNAGDKLVMAVPVTVLGVTKVNVGDEEGDKDSFGTASTNAYAQAMKRTCALFGLGLYLYDKDWTAQYLAGRAPASDLQIRRISRLSETQEMDEKKQQKLAEWLTSRPGYDAAQTMIQKLERSPMKQERAA